MKKQTKVLMIALLVCLLLTGSVFAASVQKTISVIFNSINITVNGQKVEADNILYNGTTYVPLRRVAEMLGKDVSWDANTNTAGINDKKPETVIPSENYSFSNPAPLNVAQRGIIEDYPYNHTVTVKILEITRGQKAWDRLLKVNSFNEEAPEGYEYVIAKVYIKADKIVGDLPLDVNVVYFTSVTSSGKELDIASGMVTPYPQLDVGLYQGDEATGYLVFLVDKNDPHPRLHYGGDYEGNGGMWFRLYE